ncbi:MAG: N-acetylglucosamine-6-phosphate deacetylase [Clostridiales bacterium]|nr:N-acetylglucosamine-6-phosphate deacetylase [Clostridiales bacterium]
MVIKNGRIVLPEKIITSDLTIRDGRITAFEADDSEVFDADGMYVCPGFVDIHTHGGGGFDFMDDSDEAFAGALDFHLKNGTTAILPSSVTASVEDISAMLERTRRFMGREGINVLGVHAEGPYLSLKNKGAQAVKYLRAPALDDYSFLLENCDVVKIVTLSPELAGAAEMTRRLTEAGIVVSGGHDDGCKPLIMPAIEAGLCHATHLWCAMSTVTRYNGKRVPGLCEIALTDDRITAEIIADLHHLPPELVQIIYRCKGPEQLCVVSDCLRAGGMPDDGRVYSLGSGDDTTEFIVRDGAASLLDGSRLAGSIQPLSRMVANLVRECGISFHEAVRIASLTPAKTVGAASELGSIEVGKRADLCLMTQDYEVAAVVVGGKFIK